MAKGRERVGRYRILRRLGKGGMGTVYKAALPVTGRIVALKLLAPAEPLRLLLGESKIRELFTAEAVTMARLRHPNLAEVLDFDELADGTLFFTMEYFCTTLGDSLGETYQADQLTRVVPPEKAIAYGCQVLSGLGCLHRAGIIHRDIKPFNIMLTDQDTVKISDFGLSKHRHEILGRQRGLRVGSPYYSAPEQQQDPTQADGRADLYSVAVLLYRLLTGELPTMKGFSLSLVNPLFDAGWDRFFAKGFSLRREERFQDAGEMLQALHALRLHWQQAKSGVCARSLAAPTGENGALRVRSRPLRLAGGRARASFGVDALHRPLRYSGRVLETTPAGVLADRATGLLWLPMAVDVPVEHAVAVQCIQGLREKRVAGLSQWRLPTVNELLTLVREPSLREGCGGAIGEGERSCFWSCDPRSATTAWYVNLMLGFAGWQDMNCQYHVVGVCSAEEPA